MTTIGLWVDDHWRTVLKDEYFNELKDLGISTIAIMINELRPGWFPEWGYRQIERACQMAIDRDIEVVLTTWPVPYRATLDVMARFMDEALSYGASGWEVDLEGNWKELTVRGGWSLEDASKYLVALMQIASMKHDIRLEVTTFPLHRENSSRALVAPHVDRILPQAYSVRHHSGRIIDWDDRYGPGQMQRMTLSRSRNVLGVVEGRVNLSCGLAAWDQKWTLRTEQDAMQRAYDEAMKYDPVEIRYWSSKWVIGANRRDYPGAFFGRITC